MANVTYEKEITALLIVDPYNDFISGGDMGFIRAVAEANDWVPHMLDVLSEGDASRRLRAASSIPFGSPTHNQA
jgi:hypothetical protein